jgi:hypothetical protein
VNEEIKLAALEALGDEYQQKAANITTGADQDQKFNLRQFINDINSIAFLGARSIISSLSEISKSSYEVWRNDRERELAAAGHTQEQATKIIEVEGEKRIEAQNRLARIGIFADTLQAAQAVITSIVKAVPFPFNVPLAAAAGAAQMAAGIARMRAVGSENPSADFGGSNASQIGLVAGAGLQNVYGPRAGVDRARTVVTPQGAIVNQGPSAQDIADATAERPIIVEIADSTTAKIVKTGQKVIQETTR